MADFVTFDKLLNEPDLDGNTNIGIRMLSGNRTSGKTFAMIELALNKLKDGVRHCFITRTISESRSPENFYTDVLNTKSDTYKDFKITSKTFNEGLYTIIYNNDEIIGYAVSLKKANAIKKYSGVFQNVGLILFDEYQLEDNSEYLKDEPQLLQRVILSVTRGGGDRSRNALVLMLSNCCSLLNPYYVNLGIHKRIRDNTKMIRGHGWVAQFDFNAEASNAVKNNIAANVFDTTEIAYASENVYLHDNLALTTKNVKKDRYVCTISLSSKDYGVWYLKNGFYYVDNVINGNILFEKYTDNINCSDDAIYITRKTFVYQTLKTAFEFGLIRFNSAVSRDAVFDMLSIK